MGLSNQRKTDQSTTRTLSLSRRQSALTQSFSLSVYTCLYLFSSDLCVFLKSSSRFATSTIRVDSLLLRLFLFRGSPSFQGYQNEGRGLHSRSFMLLRKVQFSRYCTAALSTDSRGYSKHMHTCMYGVCMYVWMDVCNTYQYHIPLKGSNVDFGFYVILCVSEREYKGESKR